MRNLLALFAFGLITFAAAGWYLGWYKIQSAPAATGHRSYQVDINTPKIKQDLSKGEQKIQEALDSKLDDKPVKPTDLTINPADGSIKSGDLNIKFDFSRPDRNK